MTRLKKENEDATQAIQKARMDEWQALQKLANVPPVKTYVQTTRTDISWNEAIVAGGWKTPTGKRALVFVTVERGQDASQLTIKSKELEFTDEAGERLGISQFQVDDQPQSRLKSNKITTEQYETISKASQNSDGIEMLAAPEVSMTSGSQAQVQCDQIRQTPSGEKYSIGPVIDFIPTISEDGQSVKMIMVAKVNFSTLPEANQ